MNRPEETIELLFWMILDGIREENDRMHAIPGLE